VNVLLLLFLAFRAHITDRLEFLVIGFVQTLWESNDHSSSVLNDEHSLRVQDRNQYKRVSSFQNFYCLFNRIKNTQALIKENSNVNSTYLSIGLTLWNDVILFLQFILQLEIVGDNTVVHESKSIFVIEMGMGVDVCFVSVGGPSCVTNSYEVIMLSLSLVL